MYLVSQLTLAAERGALTPEETAIIGSPRRPSKLSFQNLDPLRDGGLGDSYARGRPAIVAVVRDRNERLQMAQLHGGIIVPGGPKVTWGRLTRRL